MLKTLTFAEWEAQCDKYPVVKRIPSLRPYIEEGCRCVVRPIWFQGPVEIGNERETPYGKMMMNLCFLWVPHRLRRRGKANAMLDLFTDYLDRTGHGAVLLCVPDMDTPLDAIHSLYLRHGFVGDPWGYMVREGD